MILPSERLRTLNNKFVSVAVSRYSAFSAELLAAFFIIYPVSVAKINKYNLLFPWILLIESSLFAILEHGKMRISDVGKADHADLWDLLGEGQDKLLYRGVRGDFEAASLWRKTEYRP